MNTHLMLDFETLGTTPDTVVLSLGAVLFNAKDVLSEKEWFFQVNDQLRAKSAVSFDTVAWWLEQESKAKTVFAKCKTEGWPMPSFVTDFERFIGDSKDLRAWGNGATFDVSIIENILARAGKAAPWKFWNVRCYRTMKACFDIEREVGRLGTKHCAIEDARFQARCLQAYFAKNPGADR